MQTHVSTITDRMTSLSSHVYVQCGRGGYLRYPSSVPPGIKDVFVWLTSRLQHLVTFVLMCYTNALTYLLT